MAKGLCRHSLRVQVLNAALTCTVIGACIGIGLGLTQDAYAQNSDGVAVNLDVLDDLDPQATAPRLLMPSSPRTSGRIVLTPPPGVNAIPSGQSRVVLRPPPGVSNRAAATPSITVPKPAPPAAAPPTSVTSVAPSPPVTEPEQMAAPAPPSPIASEMSDPAPKVSASGVPVTMGPAVEAMPDPAPEPIIEPAEDQVASLPPEMTNAPISLTFGPEEKDLPLSAATSLASVTERMNADSNLRVQLLGYASSTDGSPSSVRRMSLSRALSVREFLMDAGIQSTRIEVRALGDQVESGDPNRVDVILE